MSRHADIATMIYSLAEFLTAARELGLAERRVKELTTSDGKTHQVEAAFQDALGRDVGLQKAGKGYRVISDPHGLSAEQVKTQEESIHKVVQRYAYKKVLQQLQSQGYAVAEEEKRGDGAIRLLVRKWS